MFLICPSCLHARREPVRATGFSCRRCGHHWEAPAAKFSKAYYAELADLDLFLVAGGARLSLDSLPIELGRDSDFVPLQSNVAVSRRHCRLELDETAHAFRVVDLGSRGGTFVNATLVPAGQTAALDLGDHLRLSGLDLCLEASLRCEAAPASARERGEQALPLTGQPYTLLGFDSEDRLASSANSPGPLKPVALALHGATGCRLLALKRSQVRINGAAFVERSLGPRDLVLLAGRTFTFNQVDGTLDPEEAACGPGIAVRGLQFQAGRKKILYGLDCTIPAGKLTAIIGPSGSGKSTLLRVLSGAAIPNAGTLLVDGAELAPADYARWTRANLALVPQADIIHHELSVRETLEFAVALRLGLRVGPTAKRERIERALLDLDLGLHQDQRVGKLSGGQRKRVNVAVELLSTPRILLLDEPTTGLDYLTERAVVLALRQLSRQGRTIVFVTHSLASVELADHVIMIQADPSGGRVVHEGPPVENRDAGIVHAPAPAAAASASAVDEPHIGLLAGLSAILPGYLALACRYVRLWTSSPFASAGAFLALPLMLGFLIRLAVATDGHRGGDRMLFGLIAMFWLGMNQTVREVVKERDIFLREQALGIGSGAFLLSKWLFYAAVALPQAILLSAPLKWCAIEDWSLSFSLRELTCPWPLLVGMCWLAGTLGSTLGLWLSSLCLFLRQKGEVVAVLLVILITLPQILFSAKMLPNASLARDPEHFHSFVLWHETARWPELLSYFTASRYLFLPLDAVARDAPEPGRALVFNVSILVMAGLIVVVLTWLTLEIFVFRERHRR